MNRLEPTPRQVQRAGEAILDRIARLLESLHEQPAAHLDPEESATFARPLLAPAPEEPSPLPPLLDWLFDEAIPRSFNTAGPGYLAYIPGGGLPHSALADLISAATNRFVGIWAAAPVLTTIETAVVRWLCDLCELGPRALGFLTTGGSLANFSAVVTARCERLPEDFLKGRLYVSDQTHHSVVKAARLAGFPARAVVTIDTDARFCMRLDALESAILADRSAGLTPFLVVGSAGTTNTGAVDDLSGLCDVARRHGLWMHVDAAYGGFFRMTERGKGVLKGIERADSVTLDPHKGLFLPYGTGALLVRDGDALRRAHGASADYLPSMQRGDERIDYATLTPELSRDFRGLRVWLPFQLCGARAFREALDEKLDLARWATERLRAIPGVEILAEPQLSVVAFRLNPALLDPGGADPEGLDALNGRFLDAVNRRQRIHINATRLCGRVALRLCVLSFRTHLDRMEMALDDLRAAADEVRPG